MAFSRSGPQSSDTGVSGGKGKVTAKIESKVLAVANFDRVALVVTNGSAVDAWLALGPTAVAEEGIYLKAEGGGVVIDFYSGPVSVITKSGEGLVTFSEV
jgi:hypothetical protein